MLRPEFWTDERVVALTPFARLLFLGMWNYACDNGHVDDSVLQLKIRVLPGDNVDAAELLNELLDSGMVSRVNGCLKVVNLSKKQPLDLRFLVFCDHCANDPDRHYHEGDKKASRVRHASDTRAARVNPSTARRSGDGDVDGDVKDVVARKRATRIPDDFAVDDSMREWAAKEAPYADPDRATANFIDFWTAKTGKDATKLDWRRTWQNWMRTDSDRVPGWKREQRQPERRERSIVSELDMRPFAGDPDDGQAWQAWQNSERQRIWRERGEIA